MPTIHLNDDKSVISLDVSGQLEGIDAIKHGDALFVPIDGANWRTARVVDSEALITPVSKWDGETDQPAAI